MRAAYLMLFVVGLAFLFLQGNDHNHRLPNEESTVNPFETVRFELNQGQYPDSTSFVAHHQHRRTFIHPDGLSIWPAHHQKPVRIVFEHASPTSPIGRDTLITRSHYFKGASPSSWQTDIPNFAQAAFPSIYPNIDVEFYGKGALLEFDFVVAPGGRPEDIQLAILGADQVLLDGAGDAIISIKQESFTLKAPYIYQEKAGRTRRIRGHYVLDEMRRLHFEIERYDPSLPLIIDPIVLHATYLGGPKAEPAASVVVDAENNLYITGRTWQLATTADALQRELAGEDDASLYKLSPDGRTILYATYIGGSRSDFCNRPALGQDGAIYLACGTFSRDFPVTPGAYQTAHAGGEYEDAVIIKLAPDGNQILYSTLFGGRGGDGPHALTVDAEGSVTITGNVSFDASRFPTHRAIQPSFGGGINDAYVAKFSPEGDELVFSTFLGGQHEDFGFGIAQATSGDLVIVGYTASPNFPTAQALQDSFAGGLRDAFVARLSPDGSELLSSTFFGGSENDFAYALTLDDADHIYIGGMTRSVDFPITTNAFQTTYAGTGGNIFRGDGFITKLTPDASSILFSTYVGGTESETPVVNIVVDAQHRIYFTGQTHSPDFPTASPLYSQSNGEGDAFISILDARGQSMLFSTYYGGDQDDYGFDVALDGRGHLIVVGETYSEDFPTVSPLQPTHAGGLRDGFLISLDVSDLEPN